MTTLRDVAALIAEEHGLVVVATTRADGTIQSSVVNAGVLDHPLGGEAVLGFVTYGPAKLAHLRARPALTAVVRVGWRWAAVEGGAQLIGPDDPTDGIDDEGLRLLRRKVFTAAGGSHDDWETYDRTMAAERRTVVLVRPERLYSR